MKLLLDTHASLWYCEGSDSLSVAARIAIEDEANDRFVSHVTAWEIAIKLSLGKLSLSMPYDDLFPWVVTANGFEFLLPDVSHYTALLNLPFHHRDPFDRLLITQALTHDLTLVTCDSMIPAYGVKTHW